METKSLRTNAVLNIIYTISNIIFPLITFPYVSRILSADGVGKVSFFTSVSNYAVMVASLGISTYGIRATARVRNDKRELSQVTAELLALNFILSILVIALLLLSIPFINKFQTDQSLLMVNCILILSTSLGMNWLYSGLEQYTYITIRLIAFKIISLVLVFLLVHAKSDYVIYAGITAFSTSGSYLLNFVHSRKFVSFKYVKKLNFKQHLKPTLVLFASILAVNIYTNLDTVMLGFICDDRSVGLYTVAVKVKSLLLSVVNAISAVLLPRLSYYLNENRMEEFKRILKKSTSVIALISVPLSLFFILEAKNSIQIIGGEEYLDAALCMMIVMPILIISGFSNITGNQILIPSGKDICFMKAVSAGSVIDLVLNAVLMPSYGAVGAAIATLVAEITQMLMQVWYSKEYLRDCIYIKTIIKCVAASAVSGIIDLCCIKLHVFSFSNATVTALCNISVSACIFFGIYLILLIFSKEKYTIEILQGFFGKTKK